MHINQSDSNFYNNIKKKLLNCYLNLKQNYALEVLIDLFYMQNINIQIGFEVEFYIKKQYNSELIIENFKLFLITENYIEKIKLNNLNINLIKERGQTKNYLQYEIILAPFDNIMFAINILNALKIFLKKQKFKLKPKPFASQYGNSLHINLSFNNLFLENIATQETLQTASAILCHNIEKILLIFLNTKQDCKRLSNKFLSPVHICFGVDNRFSLIRILYSPVMRLEYRLANNNTNIYLAIYSILFLLHQNIQNLISTLNNKYYSKNIQQLNKQNHENFQIKYYLNSLIEKYFIFGNPLSENNKFKLKKIPICLNYINSQFKFENYLKN